VTVKSTEDKITFAALLNNLVGRRSNQGYSAKRESFALLNAELYSARLIESASSFF
jgi:hypothetical protein